MELSDSSPDAVEKRQSDSEMRVTAERRRESATSVKKDLCQFPSHSQDSLLVSQFYNLFATTFRFMITPFLQSIDSNVSDREVRRVQRAAAKIVRQAENKRHRQAGEMQRQMEELEVKRQKLNEDGLATEKRLQTGKASRFSEGPLS